MATRLIDGGQVLSPLGEMSTPDYVSYLPNERAQRFFNAIAPAEEGDIPEESKKSHNVMVAPFGDSAPFALSKPYSRVIALKTEIECVKPVVISAPSMVDGVTFTSTADLDSEMVLVSGAGNSIFRNCTFVFTEDIHQSCVKVSDPAHVIFMGCYFVKQNGTGGFAINNTASNTFVSVVGCIAAGYGAFGNIVATNIVGSFV
ncbi:MAG: hypothetical protein CMI60_04040 [Parvibaculum sp.]|nr:hypothetical protein [Parvibaculum sp.]|tara:strand:+ start:132 stop:737 length:606 start_codon:yes stop_codon:yes gene_type:complete